MTALGRVTFRWRFSNVLNFEFGIWKFSMHLFIGSPHKQTTELYFSVNKARKIVII